MKPSPYDAVILGSGPGGYVAAIKAAHLGLRTLLVEAESIGGVCLNVGCIPSKALIHAAQIARTHEHAEGLGIRFNAPEVDYAKVVGWSRKVVSRLTKGVERLVAGHGAEIRLGRGRLVGPGQVEIVDGQGRASRVQTRNVIVATGSTPMEIPGFGFSEERIWSSTAALLATEVPERLAVLGGGVVGLELGQVFAGFGSRVTVIELTDQILPGLDRDLVQPLSRELRRQKITVLTGTRAVGYEKKDGALVLKIETGTGTQNLPCDRILVTVGRRPAGGDLGLERVGLDVGERRGITVNERLETGADGIYALGDVTGGPLLAHRASKMAEVCAEVIAGRPAAFEPAAMPAVVYTHPEIAVTGLSESAAREQGYDVVTGKFPFAASGRALTMGDTSGFVKVVAERGSGALLGVHAVGPQVSELCAEGTLAVEMGAVLYDLAATVHPHPTLSETLMEAALAALGEAVHVLPR